MGASQLTNAMAEQMRLFLESEVAAEMLKELRRAEETRNRRFEL